MTAITSGAHEEHLDQRLKMTVNYNYTIQSLRLLDTFTNLTKYKTNTKITLYKQFE
jgi:hypothetical protein